jgi:hypothetical protein
VQLLETTGGGGSNRLLFPWKRRITSRNCCEVWPRGTARNYEAHKIDLRSTLRCSVVQSHRRLLNFRPELLTYISTSKPKMEAAGSSETLVTIYDSTCWHNPEHRNLSKVIRQDNRPLSNDVITIDIPRPTLYLYVGWLHTIITRQWHRKDN